MGKQMTLADLRKLAIHVQVRGGVNASHTGDNDYLETVYSTGKEAFAKRLNALITRFPKSIKFWS